MEWMGIVRLLLLLDTAIGRAARETFLVTDVALFRLSCVKASAAVWVVRSGHAVFLI
jgi:hypothetical protein